MTDQGEEAPKPKSPVEKPIKVEKSQVAKKQTDKDPKNDSSNGNDGFVWS